MIVANLCGGIGNQLFQYSTARALALRLQTNLSLDTSWFGRTLRATTKRKYRLSAFNIQAQELRGVERIWGMLVSNKRTAWMPFLPWRTLRQTGPGFDKNIEQCRDNTYLLGYWQSEKYFRSIRSVLLSELSEIAKDPVIETLKHKLANENSVALHVRRGDYVSLSAANDAHGLCSEQYYRAAVSQMKQMIGHANYYIFSDDPHYCRVNLDFIPNSHLVTDVVSTSELGELQLMRSCRHNINANSSFSWWGAWLGESRDKVVIAPAGGFHKDGRNKDIYPERWHTL